MEKGQTEFTVYKVLMFRLAGTVLSGSILLCQVGFAPPHTLLFPLPGNCSQSYHGTIFWNAADGCRNCKLINRMTTRTGCTAAASHAAARLRRLYSTYAKWLELGILGTQVSKFYLNLLLFTLFSGTQHEHKHNTSRSHIRAWAYYLSSALVLLA